MSMQGIYIYGIINSDINGILVNYSTIKGDRVYCLPYQDISAVLSTSQMIDYSFMPKDVLARQLIKHQIVIEEIMGFGYTIIPMKLGTLVNNENEVRDILDRGYILLKDIFEKIKDKIEIDLAVTWSDLASVLKGIGETNEIKEMKEIILTGSKEITLENKIEIGTIVKNALDKMREIISSEILAFLKDCGDDIKSHALMDDTMIANFAFLMNKRMQKDFEIKLDELNSNFSEKLNFRCVEPLPPYSFYTLEIKKMLHEDFDWAKEKLELKNLRVSKNEIRKAYKNVAFSCHPDKNTGTPSTGKEFDEVNKAYKILNDYCQSYEQANHGENKLFDIEEFDNSAILVKVKE